MSSVVTICPKLVSNCGNQLVSVDLNTPVKSLSELVSKQLQLNEDKFDLMCFGRILSPDERLDSYGITNGTTVFVLNKTDFSAFADKSDTEAMDTRPTVSAADVQHMVIALRTALIDNSFRQMLDKLSETEFRENLMAVTPGLREDPIAFAILQDWDLLGILTEPTNIHRVLARHPCLLDAATYLSATFHEDIIANESTNGGSSSGLLSRGQTSYSLDAMDEDEEMDEPEGTSESTPDSNQTARQFADLMVRAYQSDQSSRRQNSSASSAVITQDMLTQALLSSGPSSSTATMPSTNASGSGGSSSSAAGSTAARLRGWATQLQTLRDLGINDEIVAIQALEATDGDVQAAINIIFSDHN